eukprot:CAMPEP_0204233462 /NCGR_PEP_ID=MMETSP0361-20130328/90216_1 /ASSEMBLY_ACC=CAM_ASM_000343 /TAXON_ID=268821 /ORGANISM="Scrippsiella Hangoei, Strain SHTV-5" /LENGTH=36 /DNA_ID= /DNA_START= /DNA_END= /DNA_ORIENTATION=
MMFVQLCGHANSWQLHASTASPRRLTAEGLKKCAAG